MIRTAQKVIIVVLVASFGYRSAAKVLVVKVIDYKLKYTRLQTNIRSLKRSK